MTHLPVHSLFHINEQPDITVFHPRPAPSPHPQISGDVVFALTEHTLHNYLLPRHCPRVCYSAGTHTTDADRDRFLGHTLATAVVTVESGWLYRSGIRLAVQDSPDPPVLLQPSA